MIPDPGGITRGLPAYRDEDYDMGACLVDILAFGFFALEAAGRHFNRGQRAFFFALGYLGWFVSPGCCS